MLFEISSAVLAIVVGFGYFDRKNLKADFIAEVARAESISKTLADSLQIRESNVRSHIAIESKKIVNACYAAIDKEIAAAKAEDKAIVARIKSEFTKVELKLKKLI